MKEIEDFIRRYFVPDGAIDFFEFDVTPSREDISAPHDYNDSWYSIELHNIGEKPIYFRINGLTTGKYMSVNNIDPFIYSGASFVFNPRVRIIKNVMVWSDPDQKSRVRIITVG